MVTTMKRTTLLVLSLFLMACSATEKPRTADFVPPTPASADFGDLRVHYNALPTLSLNDAVAREYGVAQEAGSAMVVIALRRLADGEELAAEGVVSAEAYDLQGKRQHIASPRQNRGLHRPYRRVGDQCTRQLSVRSEGGIGDRSELVKFQRNFEAP